MSTSSQFIFYFIAFVLFVVAAVFAYTRKAVEVALIAGGLAFFVFVPMWIALKA